MIQVDNLCDNHNLRQSIDPSIKQKFPALELRTISVFIHSLSLSPPPFTVPISRKQIKTELKLKLKRNHKHLSTSSHCDSLWFVVRIVNAIFVIVVVVLLLLSLLLLP